MEMNSSIIIGAIRFSLNDADIGLTNSPQTGYHCQLLVPERDPQPGFHQVLRHPNLLKTRCKYYE
jgi:hypothetical protein